MPIEFQGANAIVLARLAFNPSTFSQAWMIEHLGITPSAFVGETIQTGILFATQTRQFNLFVIPERVQLNLPANREVGSESESVMVWRIMREILLHIPQFSTPGAGMNFNWAVNGHGHPNSETTRKLFFTADQHFFRLFGDAPDACFGAYASKEFSGIRMRVDAKPVHMPNDEPNAEQTIFNFNFNIDFAVDAAVSIQDFERLFGLWEAAKAESTRIMNMLSQECGV